MAQMMQTGEDTILLRVKLMNRRKEHDFFLNRKETMHTKNNDETRQTNKQNKLNRF